MSAEFDFHEYDGAVRLGPFEVTAVPVAHPVPAFGLRVAVPGDPGVLAYTGDTGPTPALDELAAGAAVLLAEAAFRDAEAADNPPALHLTGSQAVEVARRAGVPHVVLTHIPPWYDPAEILADAAGVPGYEGTIALAEQGAVYEI
jgi:ribonuclease BN (tRNA processing enzyme)